MNTNKNAVPVGVHILKMDYLTLSKKKAVTKGACPNHHEQYSNRFYFYFKTFIILILKKYIFKILNFIYYFNFIIILFYLFINSIN